MNNQISKCPMCDKEGPEEDGCPNCPGFWFTTEKVDIYTEDKAPIIKQDNICHE
jgi:hypothetical protein